jgi:hypothetical protein
MHLFGHRHRGGHGFGGSMRLINPKAIASNATINAVDGSRCAWVMISRGQMRAAQARTRRDLPAGRPPFRGGRNGC